ncbi:MAG: hypothetical protein EOO25_12235 [Comamonadaceae bacterium]|nr:MAG: hypothetical protein EOO25_12235 [Comamonadaceae bacterium]
MRRRFALWLAFSAAAWGAAGCDNPPADSPARATQQRLVGTWLREFQEDGVRVRRVLVLQADGHFGETVRIIDAAGAVTEHSHGGEWLYDGTNLKRRYTRMDGERPSAPLVPYATFEISFPTKAEFVGIDRIRRREVRYQRVAEGTVA